MSIFVLMEIRMDLNSLFDRYQLEKREAGSGVRVSISGRYGSCVSMYTPDDIDLRALQYAEELITVKQHGLLHVADLGSSPYCPQSIRFAYLGYQVDAFDLEPPAPEFGQINQELGKKIQYVQKNLLDVSVNDLQPYSIVYTNRCLFFLPFAEAKKVISKFVNVALPGAKFFISVMDIDGPLAENYLDREKPLADRFSRVKNDYAKKVECNMPVCFYRPEEVERELLSGLSVLLEEIIQTTEHSSIKIIFKKP